VGPCKGAGCWAMGVGASREVIWRYSATTRPGNDEQFAIENGPVEIVDLTIENGDFP